MIHPDRPLNPLPHLIRAVMIQARRRNAVWVMLILLALYAGAALTIDMIGIENAQTERFIRSLGLELASLLGAILTLTVGSRLIPEEIEQRTIYPVLAKPLTRNQLLLGKTLPTCALGVTTMTLFFAVTLVMTPTQPYHHFSTLLEAWWLQALTMAILTAMTAWLSLALPPAVAILASAALYFVGAPLGNIAAQWAHIHWLSHLFPDFKALDQIARYTNGGETLGLAMMLTLTAYGALWTLAFAALAAQRFRRMAL